MSLSLPDDLTLKQRRAVDYAFASQPGRDQLWVNLATLLGTGPWSDKQIHDAIIMTLAPEGDYTAMELGLEIWTGPDFVRVMAGAGAMSATMGASLTITAGLSGSGAGAGNLQ